MLAAERRAVVVRILAGWAGRAVMGREPVDDGAVVSDVAVGLDRADRAGSP
jgi:hypothetical protein